MFIIVVVVVVTAAAAGDNKNYKHTCPVTSELSIFMYVPCIL